MMCLHQNPDIDLSKLVPTLDSTATDLASHQRDALVDRKELAQKTKDFRKLDDATKLVEIKTLLKSYQTYIDLVSNQSKTVSNAFFQAYSPLSEAPDPYPLLEASVESLVVADEIVPKLESESKQLQAANAKLTKQLEDAERSLQDKRKECQSLKETQDSRLKEVESSWSAVLAEKQDNWESREKSLEEKAENQERLLQELKASYEVSQRLDRSGDGDRSGMGSASAAELDMAHSDLERASVRLAGVESRNEQLRIELAQVATSKGRSTSNQIIEDNPAFLRLQSENSALLRKADASRLERVAETREMDTTMRSLRKELAALKSDTTSLRSKINKWNDYDEIKKELDILKSIEFATGDIDDGAVDEQASEGSSDRQNNSQNLEQLLLARNKKLNNELTILRVSHQDLASRLEILQEDMSTTNMELEKSRNLNATLENDLTRVQTEVADSVVAPSIAGTYTSRYPTSSLRRGRRASPTSSIISGMDPSQAPSGTLESLRAGEGIGGGSGILPMITAQRDRFKKRIADLESELSKAYQNITGLRAEVSSLQKDNLNLYEKTRYVNTYSRSQPIISPSTVASASAYAQVPNSAHISIPDGPSSPLDKYKSAYESRISPFAAFRGRESARALKRMSLPERMMVQITRHVLATRTSRNLFALYLFSLHFLVFYMLFWAGKVDVERHISTLADGTVGTSGTEPLKAGSFQDAG